jgi:hypothetical protein
MFISKIHNFVILSFLIVLSSFTNSCGRESEPSALYGGSLLHDYGGSFSRLNQDYLRRKNIGAINIKLVAKPLGLGIFHHFIVVTLGNGETHFLGLLAYDDISFYEQNKMNADIVLKEASLSGAKRISFALKQVKAVLNKHPYRSKVFYSAALVGTPLLGQPCSNMAFRLWRLMAAAGRD